MLFVVLKNEGTLIAKEIDHTESFLHALILSQDCSMVINS